MYSPEESLKIQMLRQKVSNNTITKEELKEGMALLARARGVGAATAAASKTRKAAAKGPINSDNMLDELGGL